MIFIINNNKEGTMLSSEITARLEEIQAEFCPSSLEDLQTAIDAGYNEMSPAGQGEAQSVHRSIKQ